jgi:hypothetical protein
VGERVKGGVRHAELVSASSGKSYAPFNEMDPETSSG